MQQRDLMTPDPREPKLTAWARDLIRDLRAEVSVGRSRLAIAQGESVPGEEATGVVILDPYSREIVLPDRCAIRFRVGPEVDDFIEVRSPSRETYRSGWVDMRLAISTGRALIIRPSAANTCTVENGNYSG